MKKLPLIALLLTIGCASSSAGELLIAGRVEKVTDRLVDHAPECSSGAGKDARRACVSNACGIETADIGIDRLLRGSDADKTLHVETPIGEWCKPVFGISPQQILVQLTDGLPRWSPLVDKNGKAFFEGRAFRSIAGVDIATLPTDANGLVPLDSLLAALATTE